MGKVYNEIDLEAFEYVPAELREKHFIEEALTYVQGNVSLAAVMLNVPSRTLFHKIKKYEIETDSFNFSY